MCFYERSLSTETIPRPPFSEDLASHETTELRNAAYYQYSLACQMKESWYLLPVRIAAVAKSTETHMYGTALNSRLERLG